MPSRPQTAELHCGLPPRSAAIFGVDLMVLKDAGLRVNLDLSRSKTGHRRMIALVGDVEQVAHGLALLLYAHVEEVASGLHHDVIAIAPIHAQVQLHHVLVLGGSIVVLDEFEVFPDVLHFLPFLLWRNHHGASLRSISLLRHILSFHAGRTFGALHRCRVR